MKSPGPHRALLVVALLFSPALTTACGLEGRDGAAADQAALHKALSSLVVPTGLTAAGAPTKKCEINLDCGEMDQHSVPVKSAHAFMSVRGQDPQMPAAVGISLTYEGPGMFDEAK